MCQRTVTRIIFCPDSQFRCSGGEETLEEPQQVCGNKRLKGLQGCSHKELLSVCILSYLFKKDFFDVDHFLSLYWVCYNIASVLCFEAASWRSRCLPSWFLLKALCWWFWHSLACRLFSPVPVFIFTRRSPCMCTCVCLCPIFPLL